MSKCWFCGSPLNWESDFDYKDFYAEGEGIVACLTCTGCGADVLFSKRTDKEEDEESEE